MRSAVEERERKFVITTPNIITCVGFYFNSTDSLSEIAIEFVAEYIFYFFPDISNINEYYDSI